MYKTPPLLILNFGAERGVKYTGGYGNLPLRAISPNQISLLNSLTPNNRASKGCIWTASLSLFGPGLFPPGDLNCRTHVYDEMCACMQLKIREVSQNLRAWRICFSVQGQQIGAQRVRDPVSLSDLHEICWFPLNIHKIRISTPLLLHAAGYGQCRRFSSKHTSENVK